MNKIFNKFAAVAAVSALVLGASSCADVLDLKPIDWPASGMYWKSQKEFQINIFANSNMVRDRTPDVLFWAGELRSGSFTTDLINASGALNVDYIANSYDVSHAQFSTFGGWYGLVANVNELIKQANLAGEDIFTDNVRNGILGIAHGWRAYAYFQMYRMYGGVPLRLEPEVQEGETDPTKLYKARATAEETLAQIKSDIAKSLDCFNNTTWIPSSNADKDYYWTKAATEMLAGEVYLWSGKVTTEDHQANAADVTTAKGYFENVINNYGFSLVKDFFSIWTTPHNSEFIYSICYSNQQDGATFSSYQAQMVNSQAGGNYATDGWTNIAANGLGVRKDGAVSWYNRYTTATGQAGALYTIWNNWAPSPNRYMYKNAMYYQFDDNDIRKDIFWGVWEISDYERDMDIRYIPNFDPTTHKMLGSFSMKFKPDLIPSWSKNYIWNNDQAIYRLPLAYLYLAEIANYEGDNAGVVKYINMVRERAYGDNWDEATYGYKAGSFRENEYAILLEKNKEFVMEGQRWWDLRRLTAVKGGSQTDHFVFQPESCIGFGLDPIANPWMVEGNGVPIETATPLLSTSEEYKLLWPINAALLASDPLIKQNPGYSVGE